MAAACWSATLAARSTPRVRPTAALLPPLTLRLLRAAGSPEAWRAPRQALRGHPPTPHAGPSEFGRQSRSLTAAYELVQAGFSNIKILDGGYNGWTRDERDIEVE